MGELPEPISSNNLSSQIGKLVDHINRLTEKNEACAKENFKKLELLGFNSVKNLKTEHIMDNIGFIQRLGIENISQECGSISEISNEIISTLHEQKDLAALRAAIAKEEEKIDQLQKAKLFFKNNIEKERSFKMKMDAIARIDPKILSRQDKVLDDTQDLTSAFQKLNLDKCYIIESLDELLEKEQKNFKIEKEISSIEKELKKYDDLPADLCLAKNMLSQAQKECKVLENEVQEHFKANSYVS
ncbi:hypothetical protein LSTR_LSTR000800 [Laodelphax striatellus]|uniref:HAUS augmin-like complex subunit 3 N-terminal domain-containing protein n=1 Tax=Laodelphax striatellus TaxID=195883 RepID=A0A482XHP3_LAOST|nr:hypothetical protein LSTR_LSTR000800 [Laodelphax striatellus]